MIETHLNRVSDAFRIGFPYQKSGYYVKLRLKIIHQKGSGFPVQGCGGRGRRAEDQRSEVKGQRSGARCQGSGVRGQETGFGRQRAEGIEQREDRFARMRDEDEGRIEDGDYRSEAKERSEVRVQKLGKRKEEREKDQGLSK